MADNLKFKMLTPMIGELRINNPARRNAFTSKMWSALPEKLETIAQTKGLKVLLLSGEGEHFSAGADISEFETLYATKASAAKASSKITDGMNALAAFPRPTIAVIRGSCVGGGCGLALCCDIRFSDHSASFSIPPAKLGLSYPFADIARLIETVGIAHAKDMLFSARHVKAKQARRMRLVNQLFKTDNLEAKTLDYAKSIAALSPQSLGIMKRMMTAYQAGEREDTKDMQKLFADQFTSADFKEGYSAFLAKRKAEF